MDITNLGQKESKFEIVCGSPDRRTLLVPVESRVGLAPSPRPSSSYRSPERPPNQSHTFPFQKSRTDSPPPYYFSSSSTSSFCT